MRIPILALSLVAATVAAAGEGSPPPVEPVGSAAPAPATLSAITRFLSSDRLGGRGTATRGHEIAALAVSAWMQAAGLEPAGDDGGWEQGISLRAWKVVEDGESLTLLGQAQPPQRLVPGVDFVTLSDGEHSEVELEAALAFVGFGISAPEYAYDDLKGVDLTGKIAVVLTGAPSSDRPNFFPPGKRAVLADPAGKMARLAARGARGVLLVHVPDGGPADSWEEVVRAARSEAMAWFEGARLGDAVSGVAARAILTPRGLEKVAVAAGVPGGARGILEKASANRLQAQDWPLRARITSRAGFRQARTANVLGLLRGSDPARAGETVVVTARLDDGERDGAVALATLLETARSLASDPRRPARSILFAATTGDAQGRVGASFLARHLPVPPAGVVACVAVGGAPTSAPFQEVVARGAEHSTLAAAVRAAAGGSGAQVVPDPEPQAGGLARSDAWVFARAGVPSVEVLPGPGGDRGGWQAGWRWDEAARFARFQAGLVRAVADAPGRPAWNEGEPPGGDPPAAR